MTLLLLTLPGSNPTLFASVYCSPHRTQFPPKISEELDLLFNKYPSHVTGGDFNAIINTSLDLQNIVTPNHCPWLSNKIQATPPQLTDTFRSKHPHSKKFTQYCSQNHQNQARLDFILASLNSPLPSLYWMPSLTLLILFLTTIQATLHAWLQSNQHTPRQQHQHPFFAD